MLAAMTPHPFDLDTLRRAAQLAGFAWSEEELQAILPVAAASAALLATLETIDVGAGEPSTQYRML